MKPYEQKNFLHNFHVCNSWYLFKLQALTLEHVRHMSLDLVAISSSFNVLVLSGHCHRFRAYLILKVFQVMSIVIQGNFLFFFLCGCLYPLKYMIIIILHRIQRNGFLHIHTSVDFVSSSPSIPPPSQSLPHHPFLLLTFPIPQSLFLFSCFCSTLPLSLPSHSLISTFDAERF